MNKSLIRNWRIYSPKLWYLDDVRRHPELVALDGSVIPLKDAGDLPIYYPGTKLLNDKVSKFTSHGFENNDIILSVSKFWGLYAASALCDEELSIDNIAKAANQWLTGTNDVHSTDTITITFKHDPQVITEYWIIPAFGTSESILEKRPAPKKWKLLGSNDKENWVTLNEHRERISHWEPASGRSFKVKNDTAYKYIRLTITEWHPSKQILYTGLRRLWIFGRPADSFILPNIQSPSEEFVYVVPRYTS